LNFRNFISFIILLVFTACSSVPRFTSKERRERTETKQVGSDHYLHSEVLESQTGTASYYANQFDGKITYSGEVYNMFGFSAAHPTFQMGTRIRVTNLSNKKSIVIPINDRMPFRPDRIIDLSLGTAQELDMIASGLAEVKVEVLEWGKGKK
jgi:rare lipoprotein A